MAQDISTSITRRSMVAGLALSASPIALARADKAYAQAKQTTPEKSLYERLGGVFAIAAVVDHFSDAVVKNPIVGQKSKNPQLREWHTGSPRKNLMKSQRRSDGPWISSRSVRRPKSWAPSRPTRARSPPGTSRTLSEVETYVPAAIEAGGSGLGAHEAIADCDRAW
jgi:hypothetical protein